MAKYGFNWAVGVTTAPRPGGASYLTATMQSITFAGFSQNVVVQAEPESPLPPHSMHRGDHWIVNDRSLGPWPNLQTLLGSLTMTYPEADAYLVIQDDVRLMQYLKDYIEAAIMKDARTVIEACVKLPRVVWSLWCPKVHDNPDVKYAHWKQLSDDDLPRKAYGALAYVLPREVAKELSSVKFRGASRTKADFYVGEYCKEESVPYLIHRPSLALHLGTKSSLEVAVEIEMNDHRQAGRFLSRPWVIEYPLRTDADHGGGP